MAREIPQSTILEDRETVITLDYGNELVILYTNNATTMNRLERGGITCYSEQTSMKTGEIMARQYKLPITQMSKFITTKWFK